MRDGDPVTFVISELLKELRQSLPDLLIGKSPEVTDLRRKLKVLAETSSPCLLVSPPGSRPESLALELHQQRGLEGPFLRINGPRLWASELTETVGEGPGYWQLAKSGTIFIEEIHDLEPAARDALTSLIAEGRAGAPKVIGGVTLRLLDDVNEVVEESFADRWLVLEVPALAARCDDIEELVADLVPRLARRLGVAARRLDADSLPRLKESNWPGNMGQLEEWAKSGAPATDSSSAPPPSSSSSPASSVRANGARNC
jgi:transcriptional regulator with AAA-type ATPase domain